MKIMMIPTKFGHTETLPFLFFQLSPVKRAQKPHTAWCLVKCNGSSSKGLVRLATEDHVKEAIKAVRAGKVIAVPTDTLYGFACDAWFRIQYAKTKSDVIAKADGTFVPREKRKKHDDRGKKKKEQHDANQAAMGLNPAYGGAYGAAPPVRIQIKENFIPYFH